MARPAIMDCSKNSAIGLRSLILMEYVERFLLLRATVYLIRAIICPDFLIKIPLYLTILGINNDE